METVDKITVAQNDFITAVSALPKIKRGPRGSFRNKIPKDTLLYVTDGQLIVETPVWKATLKAKGNWSICVSTDARRLALLSGKLKAGDRIQLMFAAGCLILNDPAFAIPGKIVELPTN